MKNRLFGVSLLLCATAAFAGCAAGGGNSNPFSQRRAEAKEIKLFVTNLAFMDATVYGVTNGARQRLGTVTGKMESVFTLPMAFPSEFYLEIDLLAGPTCRTERLSVDPGEHLQLIIQTDSSYLFCGES